MMGMRMDLQSVDIWEGRRSGVDTHNGPLGEILPEKGKQVQSMAIAAGSMM
jgi:hypothetical protein